MAAFARFSLIAMNLIFLVCGLAMFAFGLWMAVDDGYLNKFGALLNVNKNTVVFTGIKILLDSVQEASFVLMGCGLGILIIAILGFCGAIRQTVCSLLLYCTIVVILIMTQQGVVIFVMTNQQQVKEATGKKTVEMLSKQYEKTYDTSNTASIFLDYYQVENMCCGINGPTDYDKFTKWRENFKQDNISGKSIVPISCCGQQNSTKSYLFLESDGSCPNNGGTQDGCLKPVLEQIQAYDRYIIAAAVIVGLVEVLGLILGLYIAFNVAKDPEYKRMK